MKFTYVLTYFHANMEKLNAIREFSNSKNANLRLISKKQLKGKITPTTEIDQLIYGKLITISINEKFDNQIQFLNELINFAKELNVHIHSILVEGTYYTINNIKKIHTLIKHTNNVFFNLYSIVYLIKILKLSQVHNYIKINHAAYLQNNIITAPLLKKIT